MCGIARVSNLVSVITDLKQSAFPKLLSYIYQLWQPNILRILRVENDMFTFSTDTIYRKLVNI